MTHRKPVRFLAAVWLGLLALTALGQTKSPPVAALRFLVVDTFGTARVESFEVRLENTCGSEFRPENPLGRYARKYKKDAGEPLLVPFGVYELTVAAQGFQSFSMRLEVNQPQMWIPIELSLGSLTPHAPEASVTATISAPARTHPPIWIKLSERYSDRSKNALCDRKGRCRIANLRPGQYTLSAFDGGKLLEVRAVTLHDGENRFHLRAATQ